MPLSHDALIFGLGYLNGPKMKLSFGGEGAQMAITPRARAALDELLTAGYAEPTEADDQWRSREHYRGTDLEPRIGTLAKAAGLDPFDRSNNWTTFSKVDDDAGPARPRGQIQLSTQPGG